MEGLYIPGISISSLEDLIRKVVKEEIKKAILTCTSDKDCTPELLTRQKAAEILCISLPTLHDWTVKGILHSYRIGTRIRYKKEEILEALIQVEPPNVKNRSEKRDH